MEKKQDIFDLPKGWEKWKLQEVIGEGACGRVYRAEQDNGAVSAIKVMEVPADSFEIEALERLKGCPHVVEVQEYHIQKTDRDHLQVFLRMECLKSLEKVCKERELTEEEILEMMTDLCKALEKCEAEKILHRDIKPGNILLTEEGKAKLSDFGMAGNQAEGDGSHTIQGTFSYMPPEIFHGQKYDQTADIYSLGMVFYRLLNGGRDSFVNDEKSKVGYEDRERALERRMGGASLPAPLHASPELARILLKACAYRPKERYRSASALRKDLERCQRSRKGRLGRLTIGWSRKKRAALVLAAAVLTAGIFSLGMYWRWYQTPLLVEKRTDGFTCTVNRNGTLTLEGDGILLTETSEREWFKYNDKVKKIVIQGNVTGIEQVFEMCSSVEQVELPEGVETLGLGTFRDCENLKEIRLPSTLKEIGQEAFWNCGFESLKLPEGVETIGADAFFNCTKLAKVEFPSSLKRVGRSAFSNTPWLEEQEKHGDFLMANDILLKYFGEETDLVISEALGIRGIAGGAFEGNQTLQSVVMDDSVKEIGEYAFSATPLVSAVLPGKLQELPRFLFAGCSSLSSVVLPEGVKELPEGLFDGCAGLEEAVIPDGVERIGRYAFRGCGKIRELSLPEMVTGIGEDAFTGTAWYDEMAEKGDYIILDGFLIRYLGSDRNLVIPEDLGIRRVADYAFQERDGLESVVLPDGLISLGEFSFFFCRSLSYIEFPESLKEFGRAALSTTKWMDDLYASGDPLEVNGVDISY